MQKPEAPPPPTSVEAIARRLIATRNATGLNQRQFAEHARLAPNTYNQYERANGRPELDMALRLCETYGLTLDWIYRGNPSGLPVSLAQLILQEEEKLAS